MDLNVGVAPFDASIAAFFNFLSTPVGQEVAEDVRKIDQDFSKKIHDLFNKIHDKAST